MVAILYYNVTLIFNISKNSIIFTWQLCILQPKAQLLALYSNTIMICGVFRFYTWRPSCIFGTLSSSDICQPTTQSGITINPYTVYTDMFVTILAHWYLEFDMRCFSGVCCMAAILNFWVSLTLNVKRYYFPFLNWSSWIPLTKV